MAAATGAATWNCHWGAASRSDLQRSAAASNRGNCGQPASNTWPPFWARSREPLTGIPPLGTAPSQPPISSARNPSAKRRMGIGAPADPPPTAVDRPAGPCLQARKAGKRNGGNKSHFRPPIDWKTVQWGQSSPASGGTTSTGSTGPVEFAVRASPDCAILLTLPLT